MAHPGLASILIIVSLSCGLLPRAMAGGGSWGSSGGNALVCFDSVNAATEAEALTVQNKTIPQSVRDHIRSAELEDIELSKATFRFLKRPDPGLTWTLRPSLNRESLKRKIDEAFFVGSLYRWIYLNELAQIVPIEKWRAVEGLTSIEDIGVARVKINHEFYPTQCKVIQIARRKSHFSFTGHLKISIDYVDWLYQKMSPLSQIGLVYHEYLYLLAEHIDCKGLLKGNLELVEKCKILVAGKNSGFFRNSLAGMLSDQSLGGHFLSSPDNFSMNPSLYDQRIIRDHSMFTPLLVDYDQVMQSLFKQWLEHAPLYTTLRDGFFAPERQKLSAGWAEVWMRGGLNPFQQFALFGELADMHRSMEMIALAGFRGVQTSNEILDFTHDICEIAKGVIRPAGLGLSNQKNYLELRHGAFQYCAGIAELQR